MPASMSGADHYARGEQLLAEADAIAATGALGSSQLASERANRAIAHFAAAQTAAAMQLGSGGGVTPGWASAVMTASGT